ncbi:hypothetical protein BGX27_008055 [Mortierella sp. AM989]|nr:hypothetical protein BGX27_008055 [Mortierella sp. AM989]
MHRRHLAEDQSQVPQSDAISSSLYTSPHQPPMSQSRLYSSHSNFDTDTDSDGAGYRTGNQRSESQANDQRIDNHAGHVAPSEPPPTYEQSLFASSVPAWFPNPFLRSSRSSATAPPQEQQNTNQLSAPRLAPRNAPSAPPVSLLSTTSGNFSPYTSDDSPPDTSLSVKRGKRPVRNRQTMAANGDKGETAEFEEQPAMSPSYMHLSDNSSASSSPLSSKQSGYFDSINASAQRTARRLEHKQAFAQQAASAPELYPQYSQYPQYPQHVSSTYAPQSVIPAPPPRLLQFRSRNPSAVPACPFPLCQKPIQVTKIRRERGVTVWIACGLLFICNTYWTTHVIIDYFSSPNRDRVLSQETQAASTAASSSFTARKEAAHLVKGLLGIKSQRYHDPNLAKYQRHLNGLNRPTVATVGVVTDDQSALRAILSLLIIALMAMVRGLLSLSPLMAKPLFDTVHSCPHPHPYPYPEEIETERKLLEDYDLDGIRLLTPHQQEKLASMTQWYSGDEKKRLREKDETEAAASRSLKATTTNNQDTSVNSSATSNELVKRKDTAPESKPSRFRFFQRVKEIRQEAKDKGEQARAATAALATAAVANIKKKRLPWSIRRAVKAAQEKRLKFVKASQDIGRYTVVYEVECFIRMNWWKKATHTQDRIQSKLYKN